MSTFTFTHLPLYAHDLTQRVRDNKCDPVIGRDDELRRVIQVLSRKTKNNPVLIGPAGVGKTSIVEGLAHRIVRGDIPESLPKRVFSLDLAALIAGTKFQGEFEQRLNLILKEVQLAAAAKQPVILFIDEIHNLVGAGRTSGSLDASNILKPALARGELACIGATTFSEYEKYIAQDPAFQRRFQEVQVLEPSIQDTISILRGLKVRYENFHSVTISDAAIIQAVKLSTRYIPHRYNPDKSIDLVDEAAAAIRVQLDSQPFSIECLERRQLPLEIELEALRTEMTDISTTRKRAIEQELLELRQTLIPLKAKYAIEKQALETVRQLKKQKEILEARLAQAERAKDIARAADLRFGAIPENEKMLKLEIKKHQAAMKNNTECMISEIVTPEHISELVSRSTGIPAERMSMNERQKLLDIEQQLGTRIIGQSRAINVVSNALLRSRMKLNKMKRPIGSFLFTGISGSGKSETAKVLQNHLFDDEIGMIRFDMSEYSEAHSVSRLIGAPPGYIGSDRGGQLTDAVRRKMYSVVLLDEIEKAHPSVFNILLQVLDEGRLTDNQGVTVDFSNTLIILTSNIGANHIYENMEENANGLTEGTIDKVMQSVSKSFRMEFLNRLDEIVCFEPLRKQQLIKIVHLQLKMLNERLAEENVQISCSDAAIDAILSDSMKNPAFGARPIGKYMERVFVTDVSRFLASQTTENGKYHLLYDNFNNKLVYTTI